MSDSTAEARRLSVVARAAAERDVPRLLAAIDAELYRWDGRRPRPAYSTRGRSGGRRGGRRPK